MTRLLAWLRSWWRRHAIDDCPPGCPDCEASRAE